MNQRQKLNNQQNLYIHPTECNTKFMLYNYQIKICSQKQNKLDLQLIYNIKSS